MATALIGTVVGAAFAGLLKPADTYGRKPILFAIGLLYIASALGSDPVSGLAALHVFSASSGGGRGRGSYLGRPHL